MIKVACGGLSVKNFEWTDRGAMAKLGSRLNGIQEAVGSSPTSSTILRFVNKGGTAGKQLSSLSGDESFIFF